MVTDQISIAYNFNTFFTSTGQIKANNIPLSNKNSFLQPPECKSFAYIQADPVEVMEEIERLQNKMSQDYNGVSGNLMKKSPLLFFPLLHLQFKL